MPQFGINPVLLQRLANPLFDPAGAVTRGMALGERMRSNRADEAYRGEVLDIKREQLDIARTEAGHKAAERSLKLAERLEQYQAKKALKERVAGMGLDEDKEAMVDALITSGAFNDANKLIDRWSGAELKRKKEEAGAKWKPRERLEMEAEITAQYKEPKGKQKVTLVKPGEKPKAGFFDPDKGKWYFSDTGKEAIGWSERTVGRTAQDIAAISGIQPETKSARDKLRAQINAGQQHMHMMNELRQDVENHPNAPGWTGAVAEVGGGHAKKLFRLLSWDKAAQWVEGKLNTSQIADIRNKSRTQLGPIIRNVMQDTSGRYSDRDVEMAKSIEGLLKGHMEADSYIRIITTMSRIELNAISRANLRLSGIDYDLNFEEDHNGNVYLPDIKVPVTDPVTGESNVRSPTFRDTEESSGIVKANKWFQKYGKRFIRGRVQAK
jgi:hypothetical protein